jgi:site-specific recombinase XerD
MLLNDYASYLQEIQGLTPKSVAQMANYGRRFLEYATRSNIASIADLTPDVVRTFILMRSEGHARETILKQCWKLRRFLAFLHSRGETGLDLSVVVVRPRTYRSEGCPGYLTRAEVEHVISRIDRRTTEGKRDYAVIMLLATYGLRGGEVVNLRLEDIEWRAQRLHIRNRKGGGHLVHPLTPAVAHALLIHIKSRPRTSDRHVFVSSIPPYVGYKQTETISEIVKKRVKHAGINRCRIGSHVFRHSCAQRLLEEDHDLKIIADFLGHRSLETTQRYLKIDTEHLRTVALNRGEDLP